MLSDHLVEIIHIEKGTVAGWLRLSLADGSFFMLPFKLVHESGWDLPGSYADPVQLEQLQHSAYLKLVRRKALDALSRAEHSRQKLEQKLTLKGYPIDCIREILDELEQQGLQSDLRFAEVWGRSRMERKGEGPRKVMLGLRSRGISSATASEALSRLLAEEPELGMRAVRKAVERRLGSRRYSGPEALVRELQYEGFDRELVIEVLDAKESD
ncbi:regulatory protein RecX [Spirochaeta dissipatitropha]